MCILKCFLLSLSFGNMSREKEKTRTAPQRPLQCHLKSRVYQEEELFSPSDHLRTQVLSSDTSAFIPNDLMLQDHQWLPKSLIYQQFSQMVRSIQIKIFTNNGLGSPLFCTLWNLLHLSVVGKVLGYTRGMLSSASLEEQKTPL